MPPREKRKQVSNKTNSSGNASGKRGHPRTKYSATKVQLLLESRSIAAGNDKEGDIPSEVDGNQYDKSVIAHCAEDELETINRVSVGVLPVHVDVASQTAHYSSCGVIPPYSEFVRLDDHKTPRQGKNKTDLWTVCVGDTVIVNTDSAPLPTNSNRLITDAWFPFTVRWSPGEVVSIYRKFSRPEAISLRRKLTGEEADHTTSKKRDESSYYNEEEQAIEYVPPGGGEIMMEVRWLYRTSEVPIAAAPTASITDANEQQQKQRAMHYHEEVFETDHLDRCSTLCLLAPLELLSPHEEQKQQQHNNHPLPLLPKVTFCCHRFWSVLRRCLVPVGSLLSRAARGRLQSREIQRNHALKHAIESALALVKHDNFDSAFAEDCFSQQHLQETSFLPSTSPLVEDSKRSSNQQMLVEASSTFALAAAALDAHSLGIPLRGRENEQRRIANFLRLAIRSGNGRSNCTMFIAGPPGTGKTSSVKCVIAQLVEEQSKGLLPQFHFVHINCMELRDPFDAYASFWKGMTGEERTAGAAAELLERRFVKESPQQGLQYQKKPTTVVVLLDEIDYLTTIDQTVLYNFFNWPLKSEELVVLGISNTINLPERLHPRVQSRLGAERCIFQSYKVQEVVDILTFRLSRGRNGPCDVAFDTDAIIFAARKTAVFTGDIRKAFQLCRAAAECVITDIQLGRRLAAEEGKGGEIVRIPDVQRAAKDLLDSPLLRAVATCTSFEALVLVSLAALRWTSGREDGRCGVKELLVKIRGVANSLGNPQYLPVPTFDELIDLLNRMGEARYLTLATTKVTRVWALIQLNVANDELKMVLINSPHRELADKNLKSFLI